MHTLYASMIGAGIAELLTLPISIIKINYQCDSQSTIRAIVSNIYRTQGIRGFYAASRATLLAQTVSTSSKYYFYTMFKQYNGSGGALNSIFNGACSGVCASVLSHPLDVIKIYQQRSQDFSGDLRTIGPRLLYRGYSKTLVRNIMVSSMLFPLYDFYTTLFPNSVAMASMCTAFTVTITLHPIDVMRTRHISIGDNYNHNKVPIFRGLHLNLCKMMPTFIITMLITEHLKN
jgi:hypothetical protein